MCYNNYAEGEINPQAERGNKMYKHQAYNTFSGEVLTTTNGNHLKRSVARLNRYVENSKIGKVIARKYAKSWRFSHNGKFTGGK